MTTASTAPTPMMDLTLKNFGFGKVALVLTGSAVTQVMPFWIDWILDAAPDTEFRVVVRESALRFTTRHSIEGRMRSRIQFDSWDDEIIAAHIDLAEWADLILVYPATLDYASRLAHGITDSPSLLAALTTHALVCVAPALPPRAMDNPLVIQTLEKLRQPENFMVIDPMPGPSQSSDVAQAWVPPPFPSVVRKVEQERMARLNLVEAASVS